MASGDCSGRRWAPASKGRRRGPWLSARRSLAIAEARHLLRPPRLRHGSSARSSRAGWPSAIARAGSTTRPAGMVDFLRSGHRGRLRAGGRRRHRRDRARAARHGAASAITLEPQPPTRREAAAPDRRGWHDRPRAPPPARHRRGGPAAVDPADVVVLHRVVCCYPDYERLLGAAARPRAACCVQPSTAQPASFHARSSPMQNLSFCVMGREFRTFPHPPRAMLGVLPRTAACRRATRTTGVPWRVAGVERPLAT